MVWAEREFNEKLQRVRELLRDQDTGHLLITTQTNFCWLTGGRAYINPAVEQACGELLIGLDRNYLVANNIEAERLLAEEISGLPFEKVSYPWWRATGRSDALREITGAEMVLTDQELGLRFSQLRWELTAEEQARYRDTGRCVGQILGEVAGAIQPGDSEQQIAAAIRESAAGMGVNPGVTLVAVDERAYQRRHPLPTEKKLQRHAMLVLTGQKHGLYAAATRMVHFGTPPAELRQRHQAVIRVDATLIAATIPGAVIKEIFAAGLAAYAANGFADQWQYHHQGGLAGYNAREFKGTADCEFVVKAGQVYAWNPSIAGTKSEDTFLIAAGENILLTESSGFPLCEVEVGGRKIKRPDVFVR